MAREAERTVTVVGDRRDEHATLRRLRRLRARPLGRVVVEPIPGAGQSRVLAELLGALGKHHGVEGSRGERIWDLALSQLVAERASDLIVLRAHTLGYGAPRRLVELTKSAGCALWLSVHGERPPVAAARLTEAIPYSTMMGDELIGPWSRSPAPPSVDLTPPAGRGAEFPYVWGVTAFPAQGAAVTPLGRVLRGVDPAGRAAVERLWEDAGAWIRHVLASEAPTAPAEPADEIYALARAADSASGDRRSDPRRG